MTRSGHASRRSKLEPAILAVFPNTGISVLEELNIGIPVLIPVFNNCLF